MRVCTIVKGEREEWKTTKPSNRVDGEFFLTISLAMMTYGGREIFTHLWLKLAFEGKPLGLFS